MNSQHTGRWLISDASFWLFCHGIESVSLAMPAFKVGRESCLVRPPTFCSIDSSSSQTRRCPRLSETVSIRIKVCHDLAQFCAEASRGAAVGLIAEEHLIADRGESIAQMIQSQANWSDFPLIILLENNDHSSDALHRLQTLGNVTLVTRPIRIATFLNTIRAKLRDRKRQYAVRDLLIEREAANELMRRDEQRLSMALHAAKMAVWEWREDSYFWSDSLYEMLGVDRNVEPSTERFIDCILPADRPYVETKWKNSIENHVPFEVEFCVVRGDRQRRWLAGCGEPCLDSFGKLLQFSGLIWDITDRKKLAQREKLAAMNERFLAEATLLLSSSLDYNATLTKISELSVPFLGDVAIVDVLRQDGTVTRVQVACGKDGDEKGAERIRAFNPSRDS